MTSISDTIARLSALKMHSGLGGRAGGPDRLSDLERFGSNPGRLRARIFVPSSLPAKAPLVVVLHGCTQTAAGYDHGSGWSRLAERAGFALLFPEQRRENNANLCFNWFVPADVSRGSGEVMSIAQMVDALVLKENLDPQRIFVTGLSAGGAMAVAMLASYPDKFAAGAVIAGLPYACANSIPEAFERMRGQGLPSKRQLQTAVTTASAHTGPWPRLSIWQGDADRTVSPANADALAEQWRGVLRIGETGRTEIIGRHFRQVWRDSSGREAMERFTLSGMGHGTPLDPSSDGAVAGPFMLDVGLSSTMRSAQFWGIADASLTEMEGEVMARPNQPQPTVTHATPSRQSRPGMPMGQNGGAKSGVARTIEDALRAAGLMR